jgi:hypothetical protein
MHAVELAATLPMPLLASDTLPFERAAEAYSLVDGGAPGVIHMALGYG